MRPRLYLSGPITKGNRTANFAQAAAAQTELMRAGFAVMNPMLSMLHPDAWAIDHETWMNNDIPWVKVADVVYRLPGESTGADQECDFAEALGIPVFTKWIDLVAWQDGFKSHQPQTTANGT